MQDRVVIIGTGLPGIELRALRGMIGYCDLSGYIDVEIENRRYTPFDSEPIIIKALQTIDEKETRQRPTCKKHHEYVSSSTGWRCRFCDKKL
jgi:hypothetical protein